MFRVYWRKAKRRRKTTVSKHYLAHKEQARELVHAKVAFWNQQYAYSFGRIAIRNQRRCWGSCSSNRNLNFNYKILFLPERLVDYIIVHELCHLEQFNHSPQFWELVEKTLPHYKELRKELKDAVVPTRSVYKSPVTVYT